MSRRPSLSHAKRFFVHLVFQREGKNPFDLIGDRPEELAIKLEEEHRKERVGYAKELFDDLGIARSILLNRLTDVSTPDENGAQTVEEMLAAGEAAQRYKQILEQIIGRQLFNSRDVPLEEENPSEFEFECFEANASFTAQKVKE